MQIKQQIAGYFFYLKATVCCHGDFLIFIFIYSQSNFGSGCTRLMLSSLLFESAMFGDDGVGLSTHVPFILCPGLTDKKRLQCPVLNNGLSATYWHIFYLQLHQQLHLHIMLHVLVKTEKSSHGIIDSSHFTCFSLHGLDLLTTVGLHSVKMKAVM